MKLTETFDYNDEQINLLIRGIYSGRVNINNLPVNLYLQTAKVLSGAIQKVGGIPKDLELIHHLRNNVYLFSAAKTATQVLDMGSLLSQDQSFGEFKAAAKPRFKIYNEDYLETEYITAHTAADSAINFRYAVQHKDVFPRLKSIAIIDQYTTPECFRMNGVIADVDDPIWNHNIAPRHFRCRCHEERIDKYDNVKSTDPNRVKGIMTENDKDMQPEFKFNPGRKQVLFDKDHPYFQVAREYPVLAKINFKMPIPDAK